MSPVQSVTHVSGLTPLTPPAPLSQPPPRLTGERGAGSPKQEKLLPLLPVGGRAMGEEGWGDAGSCFSPSSPVRRGGGWEKRAGGMRASATRHPTSLALDLPEDGTCGL